MKIIKPSFKIESKIDKDEILKLIERAGRTAYKSEDKITKNSAEKFVKKLINLKHESVLEHFSISVRIICDRGVSHELVRHRIASYTQESTRYVNYSRGKYNNELTFIKPIFFEENSKDYQVWKSCMEKIEQSYIELIENKASPQEARSVLPNSLKTEILVTMNLRSWRNFFKLRTDKHAHPQMREIAIPLLKEFQSLIPVIFDNLSKVI